MKVKNIVFSGFAAAILVGVCGNADAAAVTFASQGYVDRQLETKQNVLTAGEGIQITDQDVIVSTIDTSQFAKKNEIPGLMETFATDEELEDLKTQLQNQIQELHKNGDYASAQDLENLRSAVEALQSNNVDKTVVDNLKASVEAIAADYVKKSELTAAEERLDAAIKAIVVPTIPTLVSAFENDAGYITSAALADYAKSADVNAALSSKADASALTNLVTSTQLSDLRTALEAEIAKKQNSGDYATANALQTVSDSLAELKADSYTKAQVDAKIADAISGGEIDLSGYAKQVDLDSLTQLVSGHTTEINALKSAGYQTSDDVQGAITTAVADLATDADLNTLKTTLQAAIDEKQAKGDYLVAADLTTLNNAITALQSGKADTSTVTAIQETISKLGDTYATKDAMTAADEALQAAIDAINVPSLEGYVKAADLAAVATSGSYDDLSNKPTIPSIEGLATSDELTTLQTTLQAAINEKQAKGDYLVAADLTTLNDAISALQSGKADASTVTAIQETISKLGDTYATKDAMTAADEALQAAIDAINVPSLEGYVKAADLAAVATTGSYDDLSNKPTIPSIEGLATSDELTTLQTTLQAAINEKQAKGDYLVAADLTTLNDAITELQSGKADASTVTTIQETISKLGDTYATKDAMTAADEALQAAIDNMDLSAYAKAADVYSKTEADAKFLIMRDANALGANLQWDEDGKLNTKGIATAEGLEDLENKVDDAVTQTELDAKGYLTAESVTSGTENGTIAVNGSDVAVKGLGSAAYTTAENYIIKPTEQPTTFGEYVLILNINEAGESEGYSWLDTLDLMGDSGFDM